MLITGLHSHEENHILQGCQTRGLLGANLHIGAMVLRATLHILVIVPRAACGFGFGNHHLSGQRSLKYIDLQKKKVIIFSTSEKLPLNDKD